jgi:hypothetical protein
MSQVIFNPSIRGGGKTSGKKLAYMGLGAAEYQPEKPQKGWDEFFTETKIAQKYHIYPRNYY